MNKDSLHTSSILLLTLIIGFIGGWLWNENQQKPITACAREETRRPELPTFQRPPADVSAEIRIDTERVREVMDTAQPMVEAMGEAMGKFFDRVKDTKIEIKVDKAEQPSMPGQ